MRENEPQITQIDKVNNQCNLCKSVVAFLFHRPGKVRTLPVKLLSTVQENEPRITPICDVKLESILL